MIQFRLYERTIKGNPEGAYLGLPGERFQPIPDKTISIPQYRQGWFDASPNVEKMIWEEWRDIDFTSH